MDFFTNYNLLCKAAGKSANGVAKELGIASGSVTQWKQGSTPRPATVERIAKYFGVTSEELLFGTKKEPSTPASEEFDKNDAVSNLRDEVIRQFPDYDLDKLNAVMDFVEARVAPEIASAGREKAVSSAFSRMTDDEFDAFLDYLNKLRAR